MILVTGATGLIGAHLLWQLAQEEDTLVALYRTEEKKEKVADFFAFKSPNNKDALWGKIRWHRADITDVPSLEKAFKGVAYVYHVAGYISFDPKEERKLRKVNIEGTANIVNLCLSFGVEKLCHVSSIATLGQKQSNQTYIDETAVWDAEERRNVYAITKYGGELEVWRGTQEGLSAVMVNPGVVVGPFFWKDSSGVLFPIAAKGLPYTIAGGTGFVDVADVVRSCIALMHSDLQTERYVLVSENWTYKELTTRIAKSICASAPKKVLSKTTFWFLWVVDSIVASVGLKSKRFFKHQLKRYGVANFYSSKKIKDALGFEFGSLENAITKYGQCYTKK